MMMDRKDESRRDAGRDEKDADRGAGGYGDSTGFAEERRAEEERTAPLDTGDTDARSRADGTGTQAESGMETDPYEGSRGG